MEPPEITIFVIESINVIATVVFLILFWRRLCKIRGMGSTNQYLDKHWLIRVIAAIIYIIISASMLTLELVKYLNENNWLKQLLLSGSVGFCINSLILIVHIIVVSQELRKQIPFSKLHQAFLIYMVIISCLRLGLVIYQFQLDMQQRFEIQLLILSISLTVVSIFMVVNWVRKKKTMPSFDDLSNVDINTITERIINPVLYDHLSISPDKTEIEHWNLIIPNTTVETGKVRIILEMYTQDDILKSLANEQTKSINDKLGPKSVNNTRDKLKQRLEIISDRLYTLAEIKKIYLQCSRFQIETKINFEGSSMADFYRQVKKFMEELFSIKKSYVPNIWQLFWIDKTSINELSSKVQKLIKFDDELAVSSYLDHNALFLSLEVFKHLWVEDHFIFYIHTVTMDHFQKAVCYKRFTDFEEFHHKLQKVVATEHKGPYKLPDLPKKHFFSLTYGDTDKAGDRRKQLESYCQQTFNDFNLMSKMPGAKQLVFSFLQLNKTFDVTPNIRKAIQFYDGLEIRKGSIYKALVEQEYVTFYQFQLFRNGIMIRSIFKRFRQFNALHQKLGNWMENCQILYKFVVLPQKVLYKSETKRHQKLINYLESIVTIKDIYKIHEVNKFFNMGHHYDSQNSAFGMSIIKKQPSDCEQNMQIDRKEEKICDFSLESEKQRMSLLIEELGQQG